MRLIVSSFVAIGITFGLFYGFSDLVSTKEHTLNKSDNPNLSNFIRVKRDIETQTKKREIPQKPKEIKQPPKRPKIEKQKSETKLKNITPDIQTPKLDFKLNLASNAIGDVAVAQAISSFKNEIAINLIPIFKIPPRYPHRAKMLKKQGYVKLSFTIDSLGQVKDIKVIEAKPKGFFEKSARQALSKWKFKPKIVGGKAVEQKAIQDIEFRLRK